MMLRKGAVFVTATDTGMGKTAICTGLMAVLKTRGIKVCAMKPVASGANKTRQGLISEDAALLAKHNSVKLSYDLVNPVTLENPCSPDIAARLENKEIDLGHISECYKKISELCDVVVVEGIGGWRTPCPGPMGMAEIVRRLQCPVILVVGMRLGCINHAVLSAEAVRNDGLELAGWVANQIDPDYAYQDQTLDTLAPMLACPLLGVVPYIKGADEEQIRAYLHLDGI
jgi:dethiobiotin synthetase